MIAKFVYTALTMVFGGGTISDVTEGMNTVLNALSEALSQNSVHAILNIFLGVAASLMTVFLFMDIVSNVQKDMITLERLILIFIKYFTAMVVLIYLEDIVIYLFKFGTGVYNVLSNASQSGGALNTTSTGALKFFPSERKDGLDPTIWPKYSAIKDVFTGTWKNSSKVLMQNISIFFTLIIPYLVSWTARLAIFFTIVSNAVMIIVRVIFAPIGIVQLFDEGQRSAGIRYLKKFLAEALTFAVIVGVLFASAKLQNSIVLSISGDTMRNGILSGDNLKDVVDGTKLMIWLTAINLASAGAIIRSGQLANDIIGG